MLPPADAVPGEQIPRCLRGTPTPVPFSFFSTPNGRRTENDKATPIGESGPTGSNPTGNRGVPRLRLVGPGSGLRPTAAGLRGGTPKNPSKTLKDGKQRRTDNFANDTEEASADDALSHDELPYDDDLESAYMLIRKQNTVFLST